MLSLTTQGHYCSFLISNLVILIGIIFERSAKGTPVGSLVLIESDIAVRPRTW
jgi:hypothetical protein